MANAAASNMTFARTIPEPAEVDPTAPAPAPSLNPLYPANNRGWRERTGENERYGRRVRRGYGGRGESGPRSDHDAARPARPTLPGPYNARRHRDTLQAIASASA